MKERWTVAPFRSSPIRSVSDDARQVCDRLIGELRNHRLTRSNDGHQVRPLQRLHLDSDDFVAALVEAWAEVNASLGFYQHYLAAESYIGSALDADAIRDVVRLVGFDLRPAIAASTVVTLDVRSDNVAGPEISAPGMVVPAGLRIQSVPSHGQQPRTFETTEDVRVRSAWSALEPARQVPEPLIVTGMTQTVSLELSGAKPKPGDGVLFSHRHDSDHAAKKPALFRRVRSVERIARDGVFDVRLESAFPEQQHVEIVDPIAELLTVRTVSFGADAAQWPDAPTEVREPIGTRQGWVMVSDDGEDWQPRRDGLPALDVLCLAVDEKSDAILAGTDGDGVYRLRSGSKKWKRLGKGLDKMSITAVTVGTNDRVYAGTSKEQVHVLHSVTNTWEALGDRVQRFRHGRRRGPDREPFPKGPVRSLLVGDMFGKLLLFATTDKGVFRWFDERKGWHGRSAGLPSWDVDTAHSSVWALALDDVRYDLYAATDDGVYRSRSLGINWRKRDQELDRLRDGVADLVIVDSGRRKGRTLYAATDLGIRETSNGGRHWATTGIVPGELDPVRCLSARTEQRVLAGGARGTGRLSTQGEGWVVSTAPEPTDPNLRRDPMTDVWSIAENSLGRRVAAMPRLDFLEKDWPQFWIDFPIVDVPEHGAGIEAGSAVVLHNRLGTDLLVGSVRHTSSLSRHDFGLEAPVQQIKLDIDIDIDDADDEDVLRRLRERFPIRETDIYAGSVRVQVRAAASNRIVPLSGDRVELMADGIAELTDRLAVINGKAARVQVDVLGGVLQTLEGSTRHLGLGWHDVAALTATTSGSLLAVASDQLWWRPDDRPTWSRISRELPSGSVHSLAQHPDGTLLAVSDGVMWRAQDGARGWVRVENDLAPADITSMDIDGTGTWWAIADGRLWRRESTDTTWTTSTIRMPVANALITTLTIGPEDDLVVGTRDSRVFRRKQSRWIPVATPPPATTNAGPNTIAMGRDGSLFTAAAPKLTLTGDELSVGRLESKELFTVEIETAADLEQGVIPDSLHHRLAKAIDDLGDLRVLTQSGAITVIEDANSQMRYATEVHGAHVRVSRLPFSLPIERETEALEHGHVRWTVEIAGHKATFVAPDATTSFVAARSEDRPRSEVARVRAVERLEQPVMVLDRRLSMPYDPSTVKINANTVEVTEGSTVHREILGSGDADISNQVFGLAHPNVTYVTTSDGAVSSVIVEVAEPNTPVAAPAEIFAEPVSAEGVRWTEVPDLTTASGSDKVYELQTGNGLTSVHFGDGINGSRLPTGHGNVTATYRHGQTQPARLAAGQLTLLPSRPKGIAGATNPLPTSGGDEPEYPDEARRRAPASTRSLGRIVSLNDYRWFAEAFPGVEHATVARLGDSQGPVMHLTVATEDGSALDQDSAVIGDLVEALARSSARSVDVVVQGALWCWLMIQATVIVEDDIDRDDVARLVSELIVETYSPRRAIYGRSVTGAKIISLIQQQPGVAGVEVHRCSAAANTDGHSPTLRAHVARWDAERDAYIPASLVAVRVRDVRLTMAGGVR